MARSLDLLLLLTSFFAFTYAHNIQMKAHSRECFHETLHKDDKMTVTFQVGDREFGGSGNLDIDFWIQDPTGAYTSNKRTVSSGDHSFEAHQDGKYTYCFSNEHWSANTKEVSFNVHGIVYVPEHEAPHDPLEKEVRQLSELLAQVKDEQGYIVVRERTHRNTAESTNARVKWWSLFQLGVLAGEVFFQVGGSLGGLFAGVALKTHGYNTTILERTPENLLHNQGAGIVAGGDTLEFFKRYDRTGKPVAVPSFKRLYLNRKGDVIHEEINRQNMTSWDLCYYLLRANYDQIDSPYLEGGKLPETRPTDGQIKYIYGATVTGIEDKDSHVLVSYTRNHHDDNNATEEPSTIQADILIAADGPSSTIRAILEPQVQRTYAGYCVIRGTVPEPEGSPAALAVFRERFCFFHGPQMQNLTYTIAGEHGTTEPGKRLLNFVWYANFPEGSPELEKLMTDKEGRRRHITIPPGMIAPGAWEMVKEMGNKRLPPQMAEMAEKTRSPFVQCITDVIAPKNLYMGDKVVLIGDSLAGFRPHTVASTSQAAFDVMCLVEWLDGKVERGEFVKRTMQFARAMQEMGVRIGDRSQFEELDVGEYIEDRNFASIKREERVYPAWTAEGLDEI
ncbi:hypothetical protein LTR48_000389 [Friedmanniomyces endolithicus]|uniref:GOLD domain-containing protein n=1 Tax=Rachicladosporium monterosium TaxID=1507873 RepID=A0ABR0LGN9_9PEZI|nr:hypothetical protein LTR48_000389 [Friedmanniomyces endolithicus]KAK5148483.1 hypothetical protein LTR32_000210 [Rachicladosporium monterosium]